MCFIRCMVTGANISARRSISWKNPGFRLSTALKRTDFVRGNQAKYFSTANKGSDDLKNDNKKITSNSSSLTQVQKLKKAVTEYGTTVIVFHVGISLISLGSCYLMVSAGLDVEQLLVSLKLDNWFKGNTMLVSNAGTFAVAYAIHKVFAPVRMAVTLGSVPFIVKYLRHKGILKK